MPWCSLTFFAPDIFKSLIKREDILMSVLCNFPKKNANVINLNSWPPLLTQVCLLLQQPGYLWAQFTFHTHWPDKLDMWYPFSRKWLNMASFRGPLWSPAIILSPGHLRKAPEIHFYVHEEGKKVWGGKGGVGFFGLILHNFHEPDLILPHKYKEDEKTRTKEIWNE